MRAVAKDDLETDGGADAGTLARILGLRVLGYTGDGDKASWIKTELVGDHRTTTISISGLRLGFQLQDSGHHSNAQHRRSKRGGSL